MTPEASDRDVEILRAWVDARPFENQEERAALARLTERQSQLFIDAAEQRVRELEEALNVLLSWSDGKSGDDFGDAEWAGARAVLREGDESGS